MSDDLIPDPGRMRASDADRERVAQALQVATGEGRLTMAELQERLDVVYAARTLGELEPLTHDLPDPVRFATPGGPATNAAGAPFPPRIGGTPTSSAAVAIMSGSERKGVWTVPEQFNAVAFWGGVELDLTQARYAAREVTITAVAIMGGIVVVVDPDTTVIVSGVAVMGAFEDKARCQGRPGGPVVRVNGLAFWGGVEVKRPDDDRRRQELDS